MTLLPILPAAVYLGTGKNRSQELFPPIDASIFVKFLRKFTNDELVQKLKIWSKGFRPTSVALIFLRHSNHLSVSR